jgi:hypothetical protein
MLAWLGHSNDVALCDTHCFSVCRSFRCAFNNTNIIQLRTSQSTRGLVGVRVLCKIATCTSITTMSASGSSPEAGEADRVKAHLSRLHSHDKEQIEVMRCAAAEWSAAVDRATAERDTVNQRATGERELARAEIASAERELDALISAPVSGGRDPFEWLPDELIVMIMLMLPFEVLWRGVCNSVCQRWARLMESAPVKWRKRDGRWAAYEAGLIKPRVYMGPKPHVERVTHLAVGQNGKLYSGSYDASIQVWSSGDGTHLSTLTGHRQRGVTRMIMCLAVGQDDTVYSGSDDMTIRVWSGDDGALRQVLTGHTDAVAALAVGLDGKIYSGSGDNTVRVWSGDDGTHLNTLIGHTDYVGALAVGLDGKIYSGGGGGTIRVWSGDDGAHIRTLEGHAVGAHAWPRAHFIYDLLVGLNGKLYSASLDKTIRVWSCDDGAHLNTLVGPLMSPDEDLELAEEYNPVTSLTLGPNGALFAGSYGQFCVWSCENDTLVHAIKCGPEYQVHDLAFGSDGLLFTCSLGVLGLGEPGNILVW